MKIQCNAKHINPLQLLKQAGYHTIIDRLNDGKESWVRLLGRGHYPRFHLYIANSAEKITFNLHLDQKQYTARIPGLRRHAGEYSGPTVQAEAERLQRWIVYAESQRHG